MVGSGKVKIFLKGEVIEGHIMPRSDSNFLVLKLDNGYNIGIDKSTIKKMEEIKGNKAVKDEKIKKIVPKKGLPNVSILHTGGTIASKVDYKTGAVISRFTPEEIVSMFPELKEIANIKSRLIGNMWSQDMRFSHYNVIAKEIEKEIKAGADGVIVTHGTDTLHYSSTALAFILEDLTIPVLLVGSQRSSDRGSSDAGMNIIDAAYFITKSDFSEVGVCMHNSSSDDFAAILPATKTRKLHTSRRDAFKAINSKPWALVDYKSKKIKYLDKGFYKKSKSKKLKLRLFNEKIKVGILKQYTNMTANEYLFFKNYDGLVIESTGLGNLPVTKKDDLTKESDKIFKALEEMIKKGLIVVLSPQTIFGRLNINVYENGRRQQEIGILGNYNDMTTETTFIKLAWLLSNYSKAETKKLILKNLRGEINERIEFEKEFI